MKKLILAVSFLMCLSGNLFALEMGRNIGAYFVQKDIYLAPAAPDSTSLIDSSIINSCTYKNTVPSMATYGGTPTLISSFNCPRSVRIYLNFYATPIATMNTRTGNVYVQGLDPQGNAQIDKVKIDINAYSNSPIYGISTPHTFSRIEKIYVDTALSNSCAYTDYISAGIGYKLGLSNPVYFSINDTASLIMITENGSAINSTQYSWSQSGIKIDFSNGAWTPATVTNGTLNYMIMYKAKLK